MNRRSVTMSRLALFRECQYSFRLDAVHDADVASAARTRGSAVHEAIHGYVTDGPDPFVGLSFPADVAERIDQLRADGCEVMSEVAMAWDYRTDTARMLGVGNARDYSTATEYDLCGTADLVVIDRAGDALLILDWKTAPPGVEPRDASDQLMANALAAHRIWPMSRVMYAAPVVREDGTYWPEPTELSAFDLEAVAVDLRGRLAADISDVQPSPGPHCTERYCRARGSCPATQERMAAMVPAERLTFKFGTPIASDEHAAWLLTALDLLEAGIEVERARCRAYADERGGVRFEDGCVWQGSETKTTKPALEVPGALAEIRLAGAEDAVSYATSWTEIERVLGKAGSKQLRDRLTAMGAVRSTAFRRYSRTKPKVNKAKEIEQ